MMSSSRFFSSYFRTSTAPCRAFSDASQGADQSAHHRDRGGPSRQGIGPHGPADRHDLPRASGQRLAGDGTPLHRRGPQAPWLQGSPRAHHDLRRLPPACGPRHRLGCRHARGPRPRGGGRRDPLCGASHRTELLRDDGLDEGRRPVGRKLTTAQTLAAMATLPFWISTVLIGLSPIAG